MRFLSSFILAIVISAAIAVESEKTTYTGYKLVRIFPKQALHFKLIHQMEHEDNVDVWHADNDHVEAMMSPAQFSDYQRILRMRNVQFEIISDNVQELIEQEQKSMKKSASPRNILFRFARYSEIINFVDDIVEANSDIASSTIQGRTRENRQLKVIKLRSAPRQKAIWIDCGIHAREWVSPSTCVYIIDKLIKDYRESKPEVTKIFDKYEIYILPLVNPDGYEFCHTTTRLWRKNRTPNAGSTCIGTDLNRNYDFQWLTNGGASSSPCSDLFAGAKAHSENETMAVVSAINERLGDWDAFISIHSYGNWWLTPYGYTSTVPADYADIKAAADAGALELQKFNGTKFTVGPSSTLLYINSGSSKDWAYGAAKIKYSYVLELRPGSGTSDANFGFLLPEDRMPLVAPETYAGILGFLGHIIAK